MVLSCLQQLLLLLQLLIVAEFCLGRISCRYEGDG